MATPMQKQRSERMSSAALEEFSRLGFHQASMDSIALKAGVSKATLYSHYETKEALFLSVFDHVVGSAIKPPDIDLRSTSLEEGVKLGFRQLFSKIAGTPEARFFFQCMTTDSGLLSEALRREMSDRFIATSLGEMKEFLRAQSDGLIYAHLDLEIIHHAIIGMILQALSFWWSREKAIPVRKLADQLSSFLLFGMAVPTKSSAPGRVSLRSSSTGSTGKRGKIP